MLRVSVTTTRAATNVTAIVRCCAAFAVCTLVALGSSGCVDRFLMVRSDPPGAQVYIDARGVGQAPVKIPFEHYGSREILLRHATTQDGRLTLYRSVAQIVEVEAPWYQWFPIDLVAEFLWPGSITDAHEITIHMTPQEPDELREALDDAARKLAAPPDATPDGEECP